MSPSAFPNSVLNDDNFKHQTSAPYLKLFDYSNAIITEQTFSNDLSNRSIISQLDTAYYAFKGTFSITSAVIRQITNTSTTMPGIHKITLTIKLNTGFARRELSNLLYFGAQFKLIWGWITPNIGDTFSIIDSKQRKFVVTKYSSADFGQEGETITIEGISIFHFASMLIDLVRLLPLIKDKIIDIERLNFNDCPLLENVVKPIGETIGSIVNNITDLDLFLNNNNIGQATSQGSEFIEATKETFDNWLYALKFGKNYTQNENSENDDPSLDYVKFSDVIVMLINVLKKEYSNNPSYQELANIEIKFAEININETAKLNIGDIPVNKGQLLLAMSPERMGISATNSNYNFLQLLQYVLALVVNDTNVLGYYIPKNVILQILPSSQNDNIYYIVAINSEHFLRSGLPETKTHYIDLSNPHNALISYPNFSLDVTNNNIANHYLYTRLYGTLNNPNADVETSDLDQNAQQVPIKTFAVLLNSELLQYIKQTCNPIYASSLSPALNGMSYALVKHFQENPDALLTNPTENNDIEKIDISDDGELYVYSIKNMIFIPVDNIECPYGIDIATTNYDNGNGSEIIPEILNKLFSKDKDEKIEEEKKVILAMAESPKFSEQVPNSNMSLLGFTLKSSLSMFGSSIYGVMDKLKLVNTTNIMFDKYWGIITEIVDSITSKMWSSTLNYVMIPSFQEPSSFVSNNSESYANTTSEVEQFATNTPISNYCSEIPY